MIIDIGKHVKCVFKNGAVVEGIVKEWASGQVKLESLNDQSIIIIIHPEEDIMLIKILPDISIEKVDEPPSLRNEIVSKLEEVRKEGNSELQGKNLKDLRKMVIAQEARIIANKIRTHFPSAYKPHKPDYSAQMDLLPRGRRK
jgi:hypothetical protein